MLFFAKISLRNQWWILGSIAGSNDYLGVELPGLGNLRTVHVLGELVQRWNPKIIFLSETKIKKNAMEKIMEKINFVNGLIVPRKGRGGGLAMLWKREVSLEIMGYSRNHIDVII